MDINDTTAEANVRDNPEAGRYEITREGRTATLAYRREPGAIALVHTFVPPPLILETPIEPRGLGVGSLHLLRSYLGAAVVRALVAWRK